MRTIALALVAASTALGQEAAAPSQPAKPDGAAAPQQTTPAAPARPVIVLPRAGDISPEVQAVLERATAAYRGCKTYREVMLTTLHQEVSGIDKEFEPPADQASQTSMAWKGADRFMFDNADFTLARSGKEAAILVKVLGEYVQREPTADDQPIFSNMVDVHPVYQALVGNTDGAGAAGAPAKADKAAFGHLLSAKEVKAEELRGVKGKRVVGAGLPPIRQFQRPVPVTLFFSDETGLLMQATYDMRAVIQAQYDRTYADMQASAQRTGSKAKVEKFVITTDWTMAKIDPAGGDDVTDAALTFKPGDGDVKVDEFHIGDGDDSVQHKLLNQPAPAFAATTLDGKPWSLKDHAGKVVLLQFWSASKGSSVASLQVFNSMDMVYKDRGVVMVGVNEDHASLVEQSKATAKRKLAAYTMLADGGKLVGNAYRVANLPCTILIDKGGVIRSITTDFDAADQVLVAGRLDRLLAGLPLDDAPGTAPFQSPNKLQTAPGATPPNAVQPATPKPSEPAAEPKGEPKKP